MSLSLSLSLSLFFFYFLFFGSPGRGRGGGWVGFLILNSNVFLINYDRQHASVRRQKKGENREKEGERNLVLSDDYVRVSMVKLSKINIK